MKALAGNIFVLLIMLFFVGCSQNFEQSYATFAELEQLNNLRLQGWFPGIISSDGYNLKETHSIGPIESFGRFSYSNYKRVDSLLANESIYKKVSIDSVHKLIQGFKQVHVPAWFLKESELPGKIIFKSRQAMYLVEDKENATIYFLYKPH